MTKPKIPERTLAAIRYGMARGINYKKIAELTGVGVSTITRYVREDFSFRKARAEYRRATLEEMEMILDEGIMEAVEDEQG